jgi:hypothetical protein
LGNSICRSVGRSSGRAVGVIALTLLFLTAGPPDRLAAQTTFAGTVIHVVHGDTLTVPGVPMQLHRVSTRAQGAIQAGRTDARGHWRFRVRLEDSASYLVSTRYDGIEFFTPPLSTDPARPDTTVQVVVADTSSGPLARARIASRHLLIQAGDSAGWRGILDVVTLENESGFTRIAPDTTQPSYVWILPPQAHEPEIEDGDVGPDAVRFRRGAMELYSPLAPGQLSFTIQYLLPAAADVGIPFGDTVTTFNLLVDGEGTVTGGPRLEGPVPTQVQGREFRRWSAPVPGGAVLQLDLRATTKTPTWLLIALVVAMAAGLATALIVALRRPKLAKGMGIP